MEDAFSPSGTLRRCGGELGGRRERGAGTGAFGFGAGRRRGGKVRESSPLDAARAALCHS